MAGGTIEFVLPPITIKHIVKLPQIYILDSLSWSAVAILELSSRVPVASVSSGAKIYISATYVLAEGLEGAIEMDGNH